MTDTSLRHDVVFRFGDLADGVVGIPCITHDDHVIESSCFYGKDRPKHIFVISTQAGCPMKCTFCELGNEKYVRNLTVDEMVEQVFRLRDETQFLRQDPPAKRQKITFANSGEPLLNPALCDGLLALQDYASSFKISTVFPVSKKAFEHFEELAKTAATLTKPVQIQISLLSTTDYLRQEMADMKVAGFDTIRRAGAVWYKHNPRGRRINLSLIIAHNTECWSRKMQEYFPSEQFNFRFREYVPTLHGNEHNFARVTNRRLTVLKDDFRSYGYDVGDWGSPSPTEWKFGLTGNAIRKMYIEMVNKNSAQ